MSKKQKINKKLFLGLAAVVIALSLFFCVQAKADENEETDTYIDINGDTTWHKGDNLNFNKNVFVNYGAVLTIEAGADIKFGKDMNGWETGMYVNGGKIIANGTQNDHIHFSPASGDDIFVMEFMGSYNEEGYSIDPVSFFRYVEIINSGGSQGGGGGGGEAFNNLFFIPTAYAYVDHETPSLNFRGGKIHMENCLFSGGKGVDVATDIDISSENQDDFLEIVNSNFEKNANNKALVSNIYGYAKDENKDVRVLLKNNWYDNELGPTFYDYPPELSWGEKILGDYTLDGFRKSDLIVDPVILVPGIMGTSSAAGESKLDPIAGTYDNLISSFESNGYKKGTNFFTFPYDWRESNADTAEKLKKKIEDVIKETKVSKVDIAAHSMGALAARKYIESDGYGENIDQAIFFGVPHKGAPKAYLRWEAGEGFFGLAENIMKIQFKLEARHKGYDNLGKYIRENIPSVGELLPDYEYLWDVSGGEMRNYPNNYPRNEFIEWLNEGSNFEKLSKVSLFNIVGKLENEASTISKIRVVEGEDPDSWNHGIPENFNNSKTDQGLEKSDGDATVPIFSSNIFSNESTVEIKGEHSDLPTKAQCEIIKKLTGKAECKYTDDFQITNIFIIYALSPIDMQVLDETTGHKVGKNFETGEIINEIPGAYYSGFDTENEFITIPDLGDGKYKILTQGTGSGSYTIEAANLNKDSQPADIEESTVKFDGIAEFNKLEEKTVTMENDVLTADDKDIIPPVVSITSPEDGKSYLNKEIINITFSVSDNKTASDKIETEVFLDGNKIDNNPIDLSLQKLGKHLVKITAQDEAGNYAENEVSFNNAANVDSIISNVNHYFDLGLIGKAGEKKQLLAQLNVLKMHLNLLEEIKNNKKLNIKAKNVLIRAISNVINLHINLVSGQLRSKNSFRSMNQKVKNLLIENINSLKILN